MATTSVTYDGKRLIPAPFISIQEEKVRREDGEFLTSVYKISVRGKLVAWKGSPNSGGSFHTASDYPADESIAADDRLKAILRKQEALLNLFQTEGKSFEVQSAGGGAPFKFNPRINNISFADGEGRGANWTEYCEYTIDMEADQVYGGFNQVDSAKVTQASNEWNIEVLDENQKTYRVTHSVSAKGKRLLDENGDLVDGKQAWENAKDYVLETIGLGLIEDRVTAPDVLDADGLMAYNYIRTQSINEFGGTFSVTENWVCYDPGDEPPALHSYEVTVSNNVMDGSTNVSINGTVTGFQVSDNTNYTITSTRWDNAYDKWRNYIKPNLLTLIENIVGTDNPLHPVPVSNRVGFNEQSGTITYNFEYNNRANTVIDGALTESINITHNHAAQVFAEIPVLGRAYGPVLQNMLTITSKRRTISIEAQMSPKTQNYTPSKPDTDALVLSLAPQSSLGVFLADDSEVWNVNQGRYNRNTTYVWQ